MSHRISTRTLAGSAMFAAIAVVLARVLSVQVIGERYSLETLPILMAGLFFGPVAGALVGFGSDLIGCLLLNPMGYNPIFCLPPLLLGLWAGLFRRQAEKGLRWTTLLLAVLPPIALGYVLWQSFPLAYLYGKGDTLWISYLAFLTKRAIQFAVVAAIDMLLAKLICYLLEQRGILPLRLEEARKGS